MKVNIADIKFEGKHAEVVMDILNSRRITEGDYTKKFEDYLAKYLGVKHAIAVTNGTVALQLVSQYLVPQKVVCVPALTFPATLNAFLLTGQYCILCDIDYDMQMDIDSLSEEDKKRIDIIVPVHLMGYAANMTYIMEQAKKYNWTVVEDAAEAFGAEHNGKKVGTFGDFATFSFFASHNIWGGELGAVVTNNDEAADVLRSMKNHGRLGDPLKFNHEYVGSNYKTNEFCAGIAYVNMKVADKILKQRFVHAQYLEDNINNEKLMPYPVDEGFSPLGYPIKVESEKYRDLACKRLNDEGIETRHIFPCLANQRAYKYMFSHEKFPVANEIEKTVFYVGIHQYMTIKDLKNIVKILNEI